MPAKKDMPIGTRFHRLVVVGEAQSRGGIRMSRCRCDCGNIVIVQNIHLRSGHTKSCGCYNREILRRPREGTFDWKHPLYCKWQGMKYRCYNPRAIQFHNYGARGIRMCDEWRTSFASFKDWALKNGYRAGLSIDRIDVNGNYEPSNCRFADNKTQGRNRRYNMLVTYNGIRATVADWAERTGVPYTTMIERYRKGWSPNDMIERPKRKYNRKNRNER